MYTLSLCLLACIAVTVNAWVGRTCQTSEDCDDGECCHIVNDFQGYSKRQVFDSNSETGTCELYKTEGMTCNRRDSCGCCPGLECFFREEPGYGWVSTCEFRDYLY